MSFSKTATATGCLSRITVGFLDPPSGFRANVKTEVLPSSLERE